jgi:hypothetical protein
MAHLDRSTMDLLGSVLRPEYETLIASPTTQKQRDLLFGYALAEAASEVERRSREARLRLREISPDLLRSRSTGSWHEPRGSLS